MSDKTPELRAAMSTADINNLPDSAFAYVAPGGKLDAEGKTVPRDLRHYPVPDKAHADDAAARASAAIAAGGAEAEIAKKALPKIKEAQAKFDKQSNSAEPEAEQRDEPEAPAPVVSWASPKMAQRAFSSLVEQPSACEGQIEVRMDAAEAPSDAAARFVGYASTTGVPYSVRDWLGEYSETMAPGAFSKTLREQENVPLLFNHDGIPLASTGSGTSRLSEDGTGLRNEADLDRRDALTNSICVQLQRGVLNKMSFSFRGVKEDWNDAYDQRTVTECALYDSSIVTYPANPTTSGELVEAMRSAMGREGRSLWLADNELSIRSALPIFDSLARSEDSEDLIEKALRALAHADEVVCRSRGFQHGRARTFLVAQALGEIRAGKVLSAKNHSLLSQALDALSAADRNHQKLAQNHQTAAEKVSEALISSNQAQESGEDGMNSGTPPGNGNPIMPQDGAGPRSLPLSVIEARRRVEALKRQSR